MWGLVENETTALLSFYSTREDTHIFILRNQESGLSEKLPQVCQTLTASPRLRVSASVSTSNLNAF